MPQYVKVKDHMSFKLAICHEIEMWNFLQLEFKHVNEDMSSFVLENLCYMCKYNFKLHPLQAQGSMVDLYWI